MSYIPPEQNIGISVPKTPTEIRNELINLIKQAQPQFEDLPGSPQNQLVDEGAYVVGLAQQIPVAILSGLYPAFAGDWQLEQLGASVGLPRKSNIATTVSVTFVGTTGVFIPTGTRCKDSTGSIEVETISSGVVGSAGSVSILCQPIVGSTIAVIPSGVISVLVSPISGVTSVTNPTAGYGEASEETYDEYRERLLAAYRNGKAGSLEQIVGYISNLTGTPDRLIRLTTNQAVNPATNNITVGGSDIYAIANAIYTSSIVFANFDVQAAPDNPNPVASVDVLDGGTTTNIKFVQPFQYPLAVTVLYKVTAGVNIDAFTSAVKRGVSDYTNNLRVGSNINTQAMSSSITSKCVDLGVCSPASFLFLQIQLYNGIILLNPTVSGGVDYIMSPDAYMLVEDPDITLTSV